MKGNFNFQQMYILLINSCSHFLNFNTGLYLIMVYFVSLKNCDRSGLHVNTSSITALVSGPTLNPRNNRSYFSLIM